MEYSLIENAMDSLNEAIDLYKEGKTHTDTSRYKFCVLLLAQSAELILKEVLYQEHEILLYEDIDNFCESNPTTVGFKKALQRIKDICKIDLHRYYQYLDELREIRNKIQHYKFTIEEDLCNKTIVQAFSSIEYIVVNVLEKTFDDFGYYIFRERINDLHEITEVYAQRKRNISEDIVNRSLKRVTIEYGVNNKLSFPCPTCGEHFLIEENKSIRCLFCGFKYESFNKLYFDDFQDYIRSHFLRELGRRRIQLAIFECSFCQNEAVIKTTNHGWICLVCGEEISSYEICEDCGAEVPSGNYVSAQSYYDANNFKWLCKECAKKLEDSEEGVEYEFNYY